MNIKFGSVLQAIRKDSNLSQQDVANIINCSRGTYSGWEHNDGEIPLSKLFVLLNHYNISLSAFVKRVQEDNHAGQLVVLDLELSDLSAVQIELTQISKRIDLLNRSLLTKT
jgi:transcriptional regulator with XRE-family HTH domain